MSLASISPFIVLHADRSALLDAKNEVLYLALWRLISRFELPLSECLRLLASTAIRLRFDPLNGSPCIDLKDIPGFLRAIRPAERNDRHNRQHMRMKMEHAEILYEFETNRLVDLPRFLSRKLITTLQSSGIRDDQYWRAQYAFTEEVTIWSSEIVRARIEHCLTTI
jgi:hypothetical protein